MSDRKPPCAAADCMTPSKTRGMCRKHYQRFLKYGDPTVTRKGGKKPTRHLPPVFEAVWPIVVPGMPRDELIAEAAADIHAVAARAGVRLTGTPTFAIHPGRAQRGSQGAAYCLVAHCSGEPTKARNYHRAVAA